MNDSFLENLTVIELASVLAGPSVGMFFAEMGARVLKYENKITGGDVTRSWKLPAETKDSGISAYFCSVNYKKNYQSIDLTSEKEMNALMLEIQKADVIIVNFKPGDAEKFGLNYERLKELNPALVYGEISGFGEDDDRVAYDLVLQAESGFMSMNGTPESGPVKMPVALIDLLAGHQLKEGLLIALMNRMKNNLGCKVHVSLFDAAVASLANQASNWLMAGHIARPIGSLHPNIAPYGELFTTSDNRLMTFAIGTDKQFLALLKVLGLKTNPEKYGTNQLRISNRTELAETLSSRISQLSGEALEQDLRLNGIPYAFIRNIREVFENPKSQELIKEEVIEGILTKRVKGSIFRISR